MTDHIKIIICPFCQKQQNHCCDNNHSRNNEPCRIDLIVIRLRVDMVKRGEMMTVDDVTDILAVNLIGAVPDDEQIVISTNRGEPLVGTNCLAGKAYSNICHRIMGEEVPFLNLNEKQGVLEKLKDIFKKN